MSRMVNKTKAVATPQTTTSSMPKFTFSQASKILGIGNEDLIQEVAEEDDEDSGSRQNVGNDLGHSLTDPTASAVSRPPSKPQANSDTTLPPEDDGGAPWMRQTKEEKGCSHELKPVYRLDMYGNIRIAGNDVQFTDLAEILPQHGCRNGTMKSRYPRPGKAGQINGKTGKTKRTFGGAHISFGIDANTLKPHWYTGICYDPNAKSDESKNMWVFDAPNGHRIFEKFGYAMIIDIHEASWNECPMHTNNGKGISNRSPELQKEHVGVIPKHIKEADYKKQNHHPPIVIKDMKDRNLKLDPLSVIQFTKTDSCNFDTKIEVIGKATEASLKKFMELRQKYGVK